MYLRSVSQKEKAMTDLASTAATTTLADHYDGPGWWPLIPLFWLALFITLFVVAARFGWWGRRRYYAGGPWRSDGTSAGKAKLAERFASGEIDEQEYRTRLAVLEQTSSPGEQR
jgi:putative membrane protein